MMIIIIIKEKIASCSWALAEYWHVFDASRYRYQKAVFWISDVNFTLFHVQRRIGLYIETALQKQNGCSLKIQIYGKNMVWPVNERLNQERHVESQTSENSLSSKFGDDA